jgi:hypothetical protein
LNQSKKNANNKLNVKLKDKITKSNFLRNYNDIDYQKYYKSKLVSSIINSSPHIVIDFRYETNQNDRLDLFHYLINEQLIKIIDLNMKSSEPFQLTFCNFNKYNYKFKDYYNKLLKIDSNIIFETSKSYMDIFSNNQLVYLTNNSDLIMKTFDPNKIYIIGALVDFNDDNEFELATYKQAKTDNVSVLRIDERFFPKNIKKKNTNILSVYDTFKILTKLYNKNIKN